MMWGGKFAPSNWRFCNGELLQIRQYNSLYSIIGTTYGGDGINTFGLPNLVGRFPVGAGTGQDLSERKLGEIGGADKVTLTMNEMAAHTHDTPNTPIPNYNFKMMATTEAGTEDSPEGNMLANYSSADIYTNEGSEATVAMGRSDMDLAHITDIKFVGGGQDHENFQPYLSISFIIAVNGPVPSNS